MAYHHLPYQPASIPAILFPATRPTRLLWKNNTQAIAVKESVLFHDVAFYNYEN